MTNSGVNVIKFKVSAQCKQKHYIALVCDWEWNMMKKKTKQTPTLKSGLLKLDLFDGCHQNIN